MWEKGDDSPFPLSLIILDIDFFKQYNDTLGHLEGDAVLKHVAEVLVSFADAGTGEVARIGGEEFSVLLPGVDAHKAFITADEIRRAVEQLEIEHGNSSVASVLTISAGVATLDARSDGDSESLFARADEALYEAKSSGRNRVKAL
jgi:diguanylate cyclase (GGDEF)-like protein